MAALFIIVFLIKQTRSEEYYFNEPQYEVFPLRYVNW